MGQCCPEEDANKVFDYRVDTMNSFKQNNRTQIRQTLTESVRRRVMIKAVIKNPMILIQIDADKYFFEEGFEWNYFCCVVRGKIELLIQNKHIKTYNEWECFGHMSLFCSYNNNIFGRAKCALRCIQKADVYVIDGETFQFIFLL